MTVSDFESPVAAKVSMHSNRSSPRGDRDFLNQPWMSFTHVELAECNGEFGFARSVSVEPELIRRAFWRVVPDFSR